MVLILSVVLGSFYTFVTFALFYYSIPFDVRKNVDVELNYIRFLLFDLIIGFNSLIFYFLMTV